MKNAWFEWGVGAAAAVLVGTGLVYVGVNSRAVDASPASNEPDPRELIAVAYVVKNRRRDINMPFVFVVLDGIGEQVE